MIQVDGPVETVATALSLMKLAGSLACAAGRPRTECPYDPLYFPGPYEAWTSGWDIGDAMMREDPIGA